MTDAVREAFESIYGYRGATSLPVSSWDTKFSTFKFGVKAGREAMREEALAACLKQGGTVSMFATSNDARIHNSAVSGVFHKIKELP